MNTEPALIVAAFVALVTYLLRAFVGPEFDIPEEVQAAMTVIVIFIGGWITRLNVFNKKSAEALKAEIPEGYVLEATPPSDLSIKPAT